jgi:hypothetical protein
MLSPPRLHPYLTSFTLYFESRNGTIHGITPVLLTELNSLASMASSAMPTTKFEREQVSDL